MSWTEIKPNKVTFEVVEQDEIQKLLTFDKVSSAVHIESCCAELENHVVVHFAHARYMKTLPALKLLQHPYIQFRILEHSQGNKLLITVPKTVQVEAVVEALVSLYSAEFGGNRVTSSHFGV